MAEVPALPPLEPDTISQDKYLRDILGVDDNNEDKVPKAPQTPTIGGAVNYHTLIRDQS